MKNTREALSYSKFRPLRSGLAITALNPIDTPSQVTKYSDIWPINACILCLHTPRQTCARKLIKPSRADARKDTHLYTFV